MQRKTALGAGEAKPRVYFMWDQGPLETAGRNSTVQELIDLAGGTNVVADSALEHLVVNLENVLVWNSELIVMWCNDRLDAEDIGQLSGWRSLSAVRNGRVHELPDPFSCDFWTLKYIFTVDLVARWCHPDRFSAKDLEELRARPAKQAVRRAARGAAVSLIRDRNRPVNSAFRRRLIYALPLPVLFGSLLLGPSASAEAGQILVWLYGLLFRGAAIGTEDSLVGTIVWEVRLPRILLTFLVGGALAAAGNALQALFRNPLVAPYILGLSSGAAFGAAIALVLPFLPIQPTAFGFGLFAVGLTYFLARTARPCQWSPSFSRE